MFLDLNDPALGVEIFLHSCFRPLLMQDYLKLKSTVINLAVTQ